MISFLKTLFNIVLPPRCAYCGKIVADEHSICEECYSKLHFISEPYCKICGTPFESEEEIALSKHFICPNCASKKHYTRLNRSAVVYDDFSKKALLSFKFHDKISLSKLFAKWLKIAGKDILEQGVDVIIPVPLSYRRLFKRKYNQSAVLAFNLSKLIDIPVLTNVLIKTRHTKPQASLKENLRSKNIKNAYSIKKSEKIKGKRVLLIDDIMTTGSTLSECAKTLLRAGVKSVDTLTIARTLKK